jgi:hypothetical protein
VSARRVGPAEIELDLAHDKQDGVERFSDEAGPLRRASSSFSAGLVRGQARARELNLLDTQQPTPLRLVAQALEEESER